MELQLVFIVIAAAVVLLVTGIVIGHYRATRQIDELVDKYASTLDPEIPLWAKDMRIRITKGKQGKYRWSLVKADTFLTSNPIPHGTLLEAFAHANRFFPFPRDQTRGVE